MEALKTVNLRTVRDALALKLKDEAKDRNVAALKQHVPDHLWSQIPVVLGSLAVSGSAGFVVPDDSPARFTGCLDCVGVTRRGCPTCEARGGRFLDFYRCRNFVAADCVRADRLQEGTRMPHLGPLGRLVTLRVGGVVGF